ncbi:MAG: VOC family protein [Nitrososphaerales archaeon]
MSLIGQLPLAAIRLQCKDIEGSKRFYKEVIGLKPIEEEASGKMGSPKTKDAHFDLGNIRLTLMMSSIPAKAEKSTPPPLPCGQLLFVVENEIDAVYADLAKRGVKFRSKKISEDSSGKMVSFSDPDGNLIYLWQPPERSSKNFKGVEGIVRHYELVSRALADLREDGEE